MQLAEYYSRKNRILDIYFREMKAAKELETPLDRIRAEHSATEFKRTALDRLNEQFDLEFAPDAHLEMAYEDRTYCEEA